MKKKLLLLSLVVYATFTNAQTKIWDFGNDTTNWPVGYPGVSDNAVIDNLGIYFGVANSTNYIGIIENSPKTFADGYVGANRFKLNGGGYSGSTFQVMPTQRYVYFATAGNCTVKVWFRTGGSGTRTLYITDGTNVVGSLAGTNSSDGLYFEANYTGSATNLYIYGDQSCNLYKIEVVGTLGTTTTLSSDSFQSELKADVFTNNNQVTVSNINEATEINVYSITGQLVKSLNTTTDVDFELNTNGFYIVNMKSSEGQKSVKIALN